MTAPKLSPRPGTRPGELDFQFRRAGHFLNVEACNPRFRWALTVTVFLTTPKASPRQVVFAHEGFEDCRLESGGWITTASAGSTETKPSLVVRGAHFALRPNEYEALREHLVPLGLMHHVYPAEPPRPPAPERSEKDPDLSRPLTFHTPLCNPGACDWCDQQREHLTAAAEESTLSNEERTRRDWGDDPMGEWHGRNE